MDTLDPFGIRDKMDRHFGAFLECRFGSNPFDEENFVPFGEDYVSEDDPDYRSGVDYGYTAMVAVEGVGAWAMAGATVVHGNSLLSKKAQHGYVIIDMRGQKVVKLGVSGTKLNKNGTSRRANAQVRLWNLMPGNKERYQAVVVKRIPAGKGARMKILEWEKRTAEFLKGLGHLKDKRKHRKP
jgi:hypothetical protein